MTRIEMAEQAVEAAKQRLAKVAADHSGPTIYQFEKVWAEYGSGSEEAERLEFVAAQVEKRISKDYFEAKNGVAHAEMLLRVARMEEK